jgi:thioredoxin-related protein
MLSPMHVSRSRRQGTIWIFGGSVAFVSILMSLLIGVPLLGADPKALEAADSSSIEGIENPQHLPMLLEFSLDICIPCRKMKPILEEVTKEYQNKFLIKILEIEDYQALTRQFDIRVVPTQIFLDSQGKVFQRHEGFLDKDQVVGVLNRMGMKR